jgi:hypothetical protein
LALVLFFRDLRQIERTKTKVNLATGRNFVAANSGSMFDGPNEFQPSANTLDDHLTPKVQ